MGRGNRLRRGQKSLPKTIQKGFSPLTRLVTMGNPSFFAARRFLKKVVAHQTNQEAHKMRRDETNMLEDLKVRTKRRLRWV
jgi:hypothetical protein